MPILKGAIVPLIAFFATIQPQFAETFEFQSPNSKALSQHFLEERREQPSRLFQGFGIAMFAASTADVATTEWALSRPQNYEANPLMANRGVRIAAHAALPAAAWWTTEWMQKQGHRKAALFLRIGVTAGYSFLALHNSRSALGN